MTDRAIRQDEIAVVVHSAAFAVLALLPEGDIVFDSATFHGKRTLRLDVHTAAQRSFVPSDAASLQREFASAVHGHAATLAVERVAACDLAGLFRAGILQDQATVIDDRKHLGSVNGISCPAVDGVAVQVKGEAAAHRQRRWVAPILSVRAGASPEYVFFQLDIREHTILDLMVQSAPVRDIDGPDRHP